jgi:hypothetical protein
VRGAKKNCFGVPLSNPFVTLSYLLTGYPLPATPAVTCWQQKCGSELFPDVPTRTLTVCGAPGTEDELLKLAIEESLKTHEAEKNRFIDLTEVNHVDHLHHKAK